MASYALLDALRTSPVLRARGGVEFRDRLAGVGIELGAAWLDRLAGVGVELGAAPACLGSDLRRHGWAWHSLPCHRPHLNPGLRHRLRIVYNYGWRWRGRATLALADDDDDYDEDDETDTTTCKQDNRVHATQA